MLETRLGVPFRRVERKTGTVTPFMSEGIVAGVHIDRPRSQVLLTDEVDDTTDGIGAIERRRRTFHNLDTSYMVEVQAVIVRIVHRFTRQAFPIYQEEDGITAEAAHVEGGLLTHGKAELQSGNLLDQQILDIRSIGDFDVMERNQTCHHRGILQGLRRM